MSSIQPTPTEAAYEELALTTAGGHRLGLRLFAAPESSSVVILAGAMGVSQRAYERFARFLSAEGFTVITFDYFGSGASLHSHLRDCPVSVTDWGTEDCATVIAFARQQFPGKRLQWMGHSVGGQLLGMTPNVNQLDHAITIACGSGYWWQNAAPTKRIAWLLWYLVAPVSLRFCGYFPGKRLNMVGDLPPNVMRQWRQWCLNPEYAVGVEGDALREQFAAVQIPITAVAFTDDEMMSEANTDSLHGFFAQAPVSMQRINPADIGESRIGHLGWFREQYRHSLWQGTLLPLLQ
ncbi:MAG: alpha/beta hydrolase [Gammaproteobacteria bacterium HGW-Gammaproteobacteria-11]|nr:MAG: alpha/beta hydrolase [Gammaproteobacteria bacterium HGW-Gammaproteobacteria-11]